MNALDVTGTLHGRTLVVFGGTGFLGKVWLSLLLERFPDVAHLYLVVRARHGHDSATRFRESIASSEPLRPPRERHGSGWDAFLRAKVTPIDGDVSKPFGGLDPALVESLRGRVDAVVNVAGVVDFSPPLEEAISVNARGVLHLCELARALGDVPVLHTSTCYTAGNRTGTILEQDPREVPFPHHDALATVHWDPAVEVAECDGIVDFARRRAAHAYRQALFHEEATAHADRRHEPSHGPTFDAERRRIEQRWIRNETVTAGTERAQHWGWPNVYTYTKALGEQLLVASGLRFTIVRPSIIESSLEYPFPGWNEGINTSAPLVWAGIRGLWELPSGEHTKLDVIPVDQVAAGMMLALAELLEGRAAPVYQLASSDSNGVRLARIVELTGLYMRRYWRREHEHTLEVRFRRLYDANVVSLEEFRRFGPPAVGKVAGLASKGLHALGLEPLAKQARSVERTFGQMEKVIAVFVPFLVNAYEFRCTETRRAYARLTDADRARLDWQPERIDWREYWLDVHCPGLEKWVFPEIEAKAKRPHRAHRAYPSLTMLLADRVARTPHAPAVLDPSHDQRLTFAELDAAIRTQSLPPVLEAVARAFEEDAEALAKELGKLLGEHHDVGPRVLAGAPLDTHFGLVHGVLAPWARGAAVVIPCDDEQQLVPALCDAEVTTAVLIAADVLTLERELRGDSRTTPPGQDLLRTLARNGLPVARYTSDRARPLGTRLRRIVCDAPLPRRTKRYLETLSLTVHDGRVPGAEAPLVLEPAHKAKEREALPEWLTTHTGGLLAILDRAVDLDVQGWATVPADRPVVAYTSARSAIDALVLRRVLERAPTRAVVLLAKEARLPSAVDAVVSAVADVRRVATEDLRDALTEEVEQGRSVGLVFADRPRLDVLAAVGHRHVSTIEAQVEGAAAVWPAEAVRPKAGRVRVRLVATESRALARGADARDSG